MDGVSCKTSVGTVRLCVFNDIHRSYPAKRFRPLVQEESRHPLFRSKTFITQAAAGNSPLLQNARLRLRGVWGNPCRFKSCLAQF